MTEFHLQIATLFIISLPVACIAWTVTHEEIFREPRDFCIRKSKECTTIYQRKFFYLFTCEYCFSHYFAEVFIFITGYQLLFSDWRGYLISLFAVVFISNVYMTLFGLLRQNLKVEMIEALSGLLRYRNTAIPWHAEILATNKIPDVFLQD